jgi:hypothetical protein
LNAAYTKPAPLFLPWIVSFWNLMFVPVVRKAAPPGDVDVVNRLFLMIQFEPEIAHPQDIVSEIPLITQGVPAVHDVDPLGEHQDGFPSELHPPDPRLIEAVVLVKTVPGGTPTEPATGSG